MTCPDCGHDNIAGLDQCGNCGQDLRSIDILPRGRSPLPRQVMQTPLRDLLPPLALTAPPEEPVGSVIRRMQENRQGSVLVMDGDRIVGIFTERDVLNRLTGPAGDLERLPVREVMTPKPRVLGDDDTLAFALNCMAVGSYRHIPVVQPGQAPRFISVRGVLRYLHEHGR
jgi:CBS domain-containing protein